MKMKKILAALAASTMAIAMLGLTVSAEGEDADEDLIPEDVDIIEEDDVIVDEPEDDVIVDEPEDDVDVDVDDTADVADTTAANPSTGNSPIALAVIPVALAAAAVVAKKVK